LGARALQLSLGAPTLTKVPKNMTNSIDIAKLELDNGVMPLVVKRKESS